MGLKSASGCLILFLLLAEPALSQDVSDSSSFIHRFSISLSTSYHYAPWKELNADHNAARDEVQTDPWLRNPRGSADNIYGDNQFEASVQFEIMRGFSLLIGGSYSVNSSRFYLRQEFNPASATILQDVFRLQTFMAGPGIQYEFRLSKVFSAIGALSAYRTFGRMKFDYSSDGFYFRVRSRADLSSSVWAGVFRGGLKMEVGSGFCVVGSINYRLLRYGEFNGSGIREQMLLSDPATVHGSDYVYDARLVSADGAFGVVLRSTSYAEYFPNYSWGPYYDSAPTRNAIVEMSGLGGEIGIEYQL